MGGLAGVNADETMGALPFTFWPNHGVKRLWLPRLEVTGMLPLKPSKGFQMHCVPRGEASW